MTVNTWAEPEGSAPKPPRVKYRIRDEKTREIVERMTSLSPDGAVRGGRWYHALDPADQHLGDRVALLVQKSCGYFYEPNERYVPLEGVADIVISDAEVGDRIRRMDLGENSREAERVRLKRYVLTDLPWDQQRALVEQIEALKREWGFEIIGPATPEEEAEYLKPKGAGTDMTDDDLRLAYGAYG